MLLVSQGFAASREIISSDEMGLISLGIAALAYRQIVATEAEAWNLCWTHARIDRGHLMGDHHVLCR